MSCKSTLSGSKPNKWITTLADQGVVSITNFLTGVIIGRVCTKDEYGLFMLCFSLVILAEVVQHCLITSAYIVYSPRLAGSSHSTYAGSTFVHQLAFSTLAVSLLVISGLVIPAATLNTLAPILHVLSAVLFFILAKGYARQLSFASLHMKTALVIDVVAGIIQLGGFLLFAHIGILSPVTAYWIIGLASGLPATIWILSMRKVLTFHYLRVVHDFQHNWSFGKWVLAGNVAFSISTQLYPWFLEIWHGAGAVGTFAAYLSIANIANPFMYGINNLIGPQMAHVQKKGVHHIRNFVIKVTFAITAAMFIYCGIMLLIGSRLVAFIYGNNYAGNDLLISLLALNFLVTAFPIAFGSGLFVMERPDLTFRVNLTALGVTASIGLCLTNSLGPIGAAGGLFIGNLIVSVILMVLFNRVVFSSSTSDRCLRN